MAKKSTVNRMKLSFAGDSNMTANQLERLRKDEREIGHYLARLKKEGKQRLAYRIQKKQDMISARIEDLQEEYFKAA